MYCCCYFVPTQLAEAKLIIDEYTGSKAPKQVNLKGHMISDIDVRSSAGQTLPINNILCRVSFSNSRFLTLANLDSRLEQDKMKSGKVTRTLFVESKDEIYKLMNMDSFQRFKRGMPPH